MGQIHLVLRHLISHFPTSLGVCERTSELMSAAERAIEASSAEQGNDWAVWVNGRASGPIILSRFIAVLNHCEASVKLIEIEWKRDWQTEIRMTNGKSSGKLGKIRFRGYLRYGNGHLVISKRKKNCKQLVKFPLVCVARKEKGLKKSELGWEIKRIFGNGKFSYQCNSQIAATKHVNQQ